MNLSNPTVLVEMICLSRLSHNFFFRATFFRACDFATPRSVSSGLDELDAAFMQRLRNLAQEALTWPHLGQRQQLVWAAALELNAVPMQERTTYHAQILNVS